MTLIRRAILAFALMAGLVPAISFAQAPPPVPALPDTERRTSYSISASTCACSVGFALFGDSTDVANWLEVFVNGVLIPQSGNWTITSPTGPLATIPRPITDAVLTFTAAQTGTVQIVGARRPRRVSQFAENRGVAARDLNQALTDIIAQNRETWDKTNDFTGRGLFSQPGNTLSMLPLPSVCAGKFLGFDATGLIPQCSAGGAGTGNVVGPVSSTIGHLALWNNTTGTLLQDFNGTSGGIPYFISGGGIGSSALLAQNGVMIGGGAGATPSTVAVGTNNQALMGNTGAAPGFRSLVAADLPAAGNGIVRVSPFASQASGATNPWQVVDPYGNPATVNCAGTTTQCVNEALTYAAANGWATEVDCRGTQQNNAQPFPLSTTSTIVIPPAFMGHTAFIGGCPISTTGAVNPIILIDSQDSSTIYLQVRPGGVLNSDTLRVKPTNSVASVGVNVLNSEIYIESASSSGTGNGCYLDSTNGSITGNTITCQDPNGGAAGILMHAINIIENNKIFGRYIHQHTSQSIGSDTNTNCRNNTWFVTRISPNGATNGISTFCTNDTFIGPDISNEEGTVTNCVNFGTGATQNTVIGGSCRGQSGAVRVFGGSTNHNTSQINGSWDYNSGNIDSVLIGSTAPGTANFTTVGATTPGSGVFTSLKGQAGSSATNIPIAGLICKNTTPTGNGADVTEDTLQTCSLPASALATVGQKVHIKAYGTFAANADNKTIKAYFGAQIYNTGTLTQNNTTWAFDADVWKTGSNTQSYGSQGVIAGNSFVGTGSGTLSQTDTGAITIKMTGQAGTANANDIICSGMFVEFSN